MTPTEHLSKNVVCSALDCRAANKGCIACIRLFCIGPCQVQQRRRSRAQTQHEGGSRDLYSDHEGRAWARGTLWPRAGDSYSGNHLPPPPSPPHQGTQDRTPSHPLSEGTPHPQYQYHWRTASEKAHFGLGYKIRGHGMDKRRMRRPLWAFQLLFRRQDSWASGSRWMTSALPSRATFALNGRSMAGQYHKTGQWQAGTGQESI
jgi:hypothetical protein